MHSRPEASDENLDSQLIPASNPDSDKRFAAWDIWWTRHHAQLYRFIRSRVDGEAEAQELLQDTLGLLFIGVEAGKYDPARGKSIVAYAFGIAKNCVREHERHDAKHTDLDLSNRPERGTPRPVENKTQAALNSQQLQESIEHLPQKRQLMARALALNLEMQAIAKELGISPGAARKLAHDTRKDLRKRLSDTIEDDIWE